MTNRSLPFHENVMLNPPINHFTPTKKNFFLLTSTLVFFVGYNLLVNKIIYIPYLMITSIFTVKPGYHMIDGNGLRPSEAACVGLIADDRKHRRQMFSFKSEAIADKRTTNPLRSEEEKERTYFRTDWTCFKANNIVCRR